MSRRSHHEKTESSRYGREEHRNSHRPANSPRSRRDPHEEERSRIIELQCEVLHVMKSYLTTAREVRFQIAVFSEVVHPSGGGTALTPLPESATVQDLEQHVAESMRILAGVRDKYLLERYNNQPPQSLLPANINFTV